MQPLRLLTAYLLGLMLAGCATTHFNYRSSAPAGIIQDKGSVQVGEFANKIGFDEPNRVRFNVVLDRPVSQAFREAVITELNQAGYRLNSASPVQVSGSIESFGFEAPAQPRLYTAQATFTITTGRQLLFSKSYQEPAAVTSIYDEAGQVATVQKLVLQFINDPQAAYILQYGTLPPVQQAQTPAPAAAPDHPEIRRSDADQVPARNPKKRDHAVAIVIGIEKYRERLPKADFAEHDAKMMSEYLVQAMGFLEENVILRTNDKASLTDLIKYFENWLPNNVEKDSSVFVYYSGHGAPNPKTGDAYLVPYDGDPTFVESTGYPLKRLYASLDKLPAKEVTVVLDSCFSGGGGRSVLAKGAKPMVLAIENPVLAGNKTAVLAASAGDQISSAYEEKGHGLLTYYFLKGLQGDGDLNKDGAIDLAELYDYIKPKVQKVSRRQFNNDQTPQLLGSPERLRQGGGQLIERIPQPDSRLDTSPPTR